MTFSLQLGQKEVVPGEGLLRFISNCMKTPLIGKFIIANGKSKSSKLF